MSVTSSTTSLSPCLEVQIQWQIVSDALQDRQLAEGVLDLPALGLLPGARKPDGQPERDRTFVPHCDSPHPLQTVCWPRNQIAQFCWGY